MGKLRSPLLLGDYAEIGAATKVFFNPFGQPRADAVVATKAIAAG
jgi:hypothetical protein